MTNQSDFIPAGKDPIRYSERIFGSWGEFSSDSSRVVYLSAHVRIGENLESHERSLIESIVPVREVLDPKQLSFAELLQRDLEDHRVVNHLIPYLMDVAPNQISFFPPLLAVLLPFENRRPSRFPESHDHVPTEASQNGMWFQDLTAGDFFRLRRQVGPADKQLTKTYRPAELEWNSDKCRLVVIDGQHRAMALLALYRSLTDGGQWKEGSAQYRHFYDEELKKRYANRAMPHIELPVTLCVFPDLSRDADPEAVFKAARKLFVDVNREAKTPNHSRLILLSETDLSEIFTRSVLDEFRSLRAQDPQSGTLPLSVIEYDTPGAKASDGPPKRAICVTKVNHLHLMISLAVWGAPEWIKEITKKNSKALRGNEPFMRRQLGLSNGNEKHLVVDGEEFPLKNIRRDNFPAVAVKQLRETFISTWGNAVIHILSTLHPFSAFRVAADEFKEDWNIVEGAESELAKEAFFDGVGTYWTLLEMNAEWELTVTRAPSARQKQLRNAPPPAVRAWKILLEKETEFESLLQSKIAGRKSLSEEQQRATKTVQDRSRTQAVQRGIIAAFATLVHKLGVKTPDIETFSHLFVDRLNQYFLDPESPRNRYFLSDKQPDGADHLSFYSFKKNLDGKRWTHIRWLILEAFCRSPFPWSTELLDLIDKKKLNSLNELSDVAKKMIYESVREEFLSHSGFKKGDHAKPEADAAWDPEKLLMDQRYVEWFGKRAHHDSEELLATQDSALEPGEDQLEAQKSSLQRVETEQSVGDDDDDDFDEDDEGFDEDDDEDFDEDDDDEDFDDE